MQRCTPSLLEGKRRGWRAARPRPPGTGPVLSRCPSSAPSLLCSSGRDGGGRGQNADSGHGSEGSRRPGHGGARRPRQRDAAAAGGQRACGRIRLSPAWTRPDRTSPARAGHGRPRHPPPWWWRERLLPPSLLHAGPVRRPGSSRRELQAEALRLRAEQRCRGGAAVAEEQRRERRSRGGASIRGRRVDPGTPGREARCRR